MGAVFGGGKGAAIGAASGAGAGLMTQLFTRGKRVTVPAEATLIFKLDRTLVLRPQVSNGSSERDLFPENPRGYVRNDPAAAADSFAASHF